MALVFFDIDGTLWDRHCQIPDSTKEALRLLKENGHQIFLCSGRPRISIRGEELFAQGFDGVISGCGTQIEYRGNKLLYKEIDKDVLARSIAMFYEYEMPMVVEAHDTLFMDAEIISRDAYGKFLLEEFRDCVEPIRDNEGRWKASKFNVLIGGTKYEEVIEALREFYEFHVHDGIVMEVVPKGYSKSTAIAEICRQLGVSKEETYAFGDGANDIDMLDYCAVGIVMGNGAAVAKEHADYVTDDIHADGIYNACKKFGLIG